MMAAANAPTAPAVPAQAAVPAPGDVPLEAGTRGETARALHASVWGAPVCGPRPHPGRPWRGVPEVPSQDTDTPAAATLPGPDAATAAPAAAAPAAPPSDASPAGPAPAEVTLVTSPPSTGAVASAPQVGVPDPSGTEPAPAPVITPPAAEVPVATTPPTTAPEPQAAPAAVVDAPMPDAGQPARESRTVRVHDAPDPAAPVNGHAQTHAPTTVADTTAPRVAAPAGMAERIADLAHRLETAPPPRRLTLEVGDVRVAVRLGHDGVHVTVHGAPEAAGTWQQDVGTALAQRGLDLAGFTTDAGDGSAGTHDPGQDPRPDRGHDDPTRGDHRPSRRPARPARHVGLGL